MTVSVLELECSGFINQILVDSTVIIYVLASLFYFS